MIGAIGPEFDQRFFDKFASVTTRDAPGGNRVCCLIRIHGEGHSVSIESKNIARKFWIWVTRKKEEYNLQTNIKFLSDKIRGGIRKIAEGSLDPVTEQKVVACYKRYRFLVEHYAQSHVKEPSFTAHDFEDRYLSSPLKDMFLEHKEMLRKWESEGTNIHKIVARLVQNSIASVRGGALYQKETLAEDIRTLFSLFDEASRLDTSSGVSIPDWILSMSSEEGYPTFSSELDELKSGWEKLFLDVRHWYFGITPLIDLTQKLRVGLQQLEQRRFNIQEKLEEFRADQEFSRWEQDGNEGKRLFATYARYYIDVSKRSIHDLRHEYGEEREAKKQALSLFRQGVIACSDFSDYNLSQRLADCRRKYRGPFDEEELSAIYDDWRKLEPRYALSGCSKVNPLELKEKLESATKDLDTRLSQFLRARGERGV